MKVGVIVPQGWQGEYDGWDSVDAWRRTVAVAHQAERLGFESIWLFDHFHTIPRPTDEITFESFTALSALAGLTSRVRLGHVVICTGFRNPALTAKTTTGRVWQQSSPASVTEERSDHRATGSPAPAPSEDEVLLGS